MVRSAWDNMEPANQGKLNSFGVVAFLSGKENNVKALFQQIPGDTQDADLKKGSEKLATAMKTGGVEFVTKLNDGLADPNTRNTIVEMAKADPEKLNQVIDEVIANPVNTKNIVAASAKQGWKGHTFGENQTKGNNGPESALDVPTDWVKPPEEALATAATTSESSATAPASTVAAVEGEGPSAADAALLGGVQNGQGIFDGIGDFFNGGGMEQLWSKLKEVFSSLMDALSEAFTVDGKGNLFSSLTESLGAKPETTNTDPTLDATAPAPGMEAKTTAPGLTVT